MKVNVKAKKIKSCVVCRFSKFEFMFFSKDRMFDIPGKFIVKKCNNCSLVFLDPQPSQNLLKKYYPSKKYYAYSRTNEKDIFMIVRNYLIRHYYAQDLFSRFISSFIQNVPALPSYVKNGRILDIGCGDGDTLVLLKSLGWEPHGLDIDLRSVEVARKRGIYARHGTYKELLKYPDKYFDAIRLYHVIEHVDDPALCLSLIHKKLKKGGELLIGTPSVDSVVAKLFKQYWYNLDTPRHLFLFSPQTLGKVLNKNNFTIKRVEFCSAGGIPGSLSYVISELLHKKINLIKMPIVLFFYPLEWLLNKLKIGDVFVIRSSIKSS
ncbi:MAG: class I SAM-dependent methyltransferase [Candidatus Levybacteria bacterium]|nr:class I SAM-dependent methyltransferase [Candidatus Levybacteria bacterium]